MLKQDEADDLRTALENWRRDLQVDDSSNYAARIRHLLSVIDNETDHKHDNKDGPACACCGDKTGGLYVHSRCHPSVPVEVILHDSNVMNIQCGKCKRTVVKFSVSPYKL